MENSSWKNANRKEIFRQGFDIMAKYTVEFKTKDGKMIYPKIITIDCMEFENAKVVEI